MKVHQRFATVRNRSWTVARIVISIAWITTPTQCHVISSNYESSERFLGMSTCYFGYIDPLKMKYFSETLFFSSVGYSYVSLLIQRKRIECLSQAFDFIGNL